MTVRTYAFIAYARMTSYLLAPLRRAGTVSHTLCYGNISNMESLHLLSVEDNISYMSSSSLANIFLNNHVLNSLFKHSAKYKIDNTCVISRYLPSLNLAINTRCKVVECCKEHLKVITLNESISRTVYIPRSLFRFYVTFEDNESL